jgi:methylenetetrahydrofolate reductase (NADPH)
MQLGLTDILIINGDNKENLPLENRPNTLELVTACSKTFPKLNIYCGLDPYRASIKNELTYCRQKLAAGAKGFFTQPFFDAHLAQIYLEHLADAPIFLGITPVLSEKSKSYWENRNNAIFPNNFCLDIPCNIQIAKELIALTQKFQQHTYLMPITMTPADYVQAIFN